MVDRREVKNQSCPDPPESRGRIAAPLPVAGPGRLDGLAGKTVLFMASLYKVPLKETPVRIPAILMA